MAANITSELASIVVLSASAQWLATRLRIPSILLLLAFGLAAGPLTGWLNPDELFGALLLPIVSLSVAVILFEGGLSLKLRELADIGGVLLRLTTAAVAVSWLGTALAARLLLGFDWALAVLLGAILVVTGPTVIGPLLRHLRLGGPVGKLLKWEGIVIDPVGAVLAVLVFAFLHATRLSEATTTIGFHLFATGVVGIGLGVAAAYALVWPLSRYAVPDSLHGIVTLAMLVGTFALADRLVEESGLLAVTVMGIAVANQRRIAVRHLVEFKENLTVLLVSSLFIILGARLRVDDLRALDSGAFLFLAALVLVVRPLSILAATLGSPLGWPERAFLAWMAPRGIVAAAVASVFALELIAAGHPQAARLPPLTFFVVLGTVALYGLSAPPLARWLGLAQPDPQGVLFIGAHGVARALAAGLREQGVATLLLDSDHANVAAARLAGLPAHFASALAEETIEEIDLGDFGRLLALTANDEVNSLACLRFIEFFGRGEVYQLAFEQTEGRRQAVSLEQRGRFLFGPDVTHHGIVQRFGDAPQTKATPLSKEFDYQAFRDTHEQSLLPVFVLRAGGRVAPITAQDAPLPAPGDVVLSLIAIQPLEQPG